MKNNQKIPEGWSVKKLGLCLSLLKDGTHGTHIDVPNGIMLLSAKDVINGQIILSKDSRRISIGDFNLLHKKYHIQNGDVVLTIVGTIGRCAIIDNYNDNYTFQRSVAILRPYKEITSKYLLTYIQGSSFQKELLKRQSVSAQPGVYLDDLSKIYLLLPPLAEQEKIAEILGTWNEAIEKLSNLIEQKKLLKKGLMQKLLTGKVRLLKTSPLAGEVADLSASEGLDYNDNIKISSHRMYQPYIKEFSRDMRKNSTKAENLLWQKIRNGQLGFKFRRQHQIDNKYIADFICLEKRLIIELDGGHHNDRPKDKDRTLYLENNNFKVIRFWDNEILQNIDGCLEILLKEISLLNNPSPCPSPARGEGISGTYSNSLPQGARKDVEYSLDTPHLAQECHPLPQVARKNERFSQPWKEVKLGEIGTTYMGLSGKNKDNFGQGSYFIPYMNIYQNNRINPQQLELVDIGEGEKQNIVKYGDIFFTTSSETPKEVGFASVLLFKPEQNIYLNSFCFGYRLNDFQSLLPEYASFLFRSTRARKIMYKLAQGATRFNLSKNELMKEKIYIPSDISEQQAIADVLSTADDEIDLLNKKLILFKEQKKGLMQQLLTGNIRVKVN